MSFQSKMDAAAQRQQLRTGQGGDLLYRQLSYLFTLILRNLYPARALCGPQVSPAPPAACDVRKSLVYLDLDELLGTRQDLEGTLPVRNVTGTLGVALHEVGHAKHSLPWVLEDIHQHHTDQITQDATLLEEPRMEAQLLRDFAPGSTRHTFLQTAIPIAVADHILPRLLQALQQQPGGRDAAARSLVYTWGRVPAGTLQPHDCQALQPLWDSTLGTLDTQALKDLMADVVTIGDTDIDALVAAAIRYRDIVGDPDEQPGDGDGDGDKQPGGGAPGDGAPGDGQGGTPGGSTGDGDADGDGDSGGSLAERMQEAIDRAKASAGQRLRAQQDQQNAVAQTLEATTEQVNQTSDRARQPGATASAMNSPGGTGLPSGRLQDLGPDRPPTPDERRFADDLARQLRRATTQRSRSVDKRLPGGTFDSRQAMRAHAQRTRGMPVTARPWSVEPASRQRLRSPHVLLVVDTSGSMSGSRGLLGVLAWCLDHAFRQIDGKLVVTAFGNGIGMVHNGSRALKRVPDIRTGGGTAYGAEAITLGAGHLQLEDQLRPRAIYVLSDGGWIDTANGVAQITRYAEIGVPTIHLSIGVEPLGLQASELVVITDADQAAVAIADRTAAALSGAR